MALRSIPGNIRSLVRALGGPIAAAVIATGSAAAPIYPSDDEAGLNFTAAVPTAHFQSMGTGVCQAGTCIVDFATVDAGRAQLIDYVSCVDKGGDGTWGQGSLQVVTGNGGSRFAQYLYPAFTSEGSPVTLVVAQPADVRVPSGQHARISVQTFDETGHATLSCSIAGTFSDQ
jgi:hypothetical protein